MSPGRTGQWSKASTIEQVILNMCTVSQFGIMNNEILNIQNVNTCIRCVHVCVARTQYVTSTNSNERALFYTNWRWADLEKTWCFCASSLRESPASTSQCSGRSEMCVANERRVRKTSLKQGSWSSKKKGVSETSACITGWRILYDWRQSTLDDTQRILMCLRFKLSISLHL